MGTKDGKRLSVGLIGVGNAGSALARPLSARFEVHAHDANPARRDHVAGLPVAWCESVVQVVGAAEVVLLSLPHPDASRAVVEQLARAAPSPRLVIETSTITPGVAQALARRCRASGIGFVDAAVAGGVQSMAAGDVTFLVGGSADDVEAARVVLEPLASAIHLLGPVGAGSGAKVVNNAVMHALMVVLVEAAAMGRKLDIPLDKLITILARPDGLTRPLEHRLRDRVGRGEFEGGMSVSNARKDSVLALETAQALGVPLFAISASHTAYEIAESLGYGSLDYASLAKLWESWIGATLGGGGSGDAE